jgi:hypothetical protein
LDLKELCQPCELRPIRFLEIMELYVWRINACSIAYKRNLTRKELIEAAGDPTDR